MGVGKSTIGKKLARHLDFTFLDLDADFEHKYKITIGGFFSRYDEDLFRNLEQSLLFETFGTENLVVATGGGAPCYKQSMEEINRNGLSVYLKMPVGALVSRLSSAKKKRPLLAGLSGDKLHQYVGNKLAEREPFYHKARFEVDALNIDYMKLAHQLRDELNRTDTN